MNYRNQLQNLYYQLFGEHLFTSLNKLPVFIRKQIIRKNYGERIWNEYPIIKATDNTELLFIHIPKCGGTSVANSIGIDEIRHIPVSVFYTTDKQRFDNAFVFSVLRNPLERIASILMHFNGSQFAKAREKKIFKKCKISDENIYESVNKYLDDSKFLKKLYSNSEPGRSGFSVSQYDYVASKENLIVGNLFLIEKMGYLVSLLSEKLGGEVEIMHNNKSFRENNDFITKKMEDKARALLPKDYYIYDSLLESGGVILNHSAEFKAITEGLKAL